MAKENKNKSGLGAGLGIAAVAAAAFGAYFLYGTKKGKEGRKKVKGWMLKAKGEVLEKVEELKEVNKDVYEKVVDTVMAKYHGLKNIDLDELEEIKNELKEHFDSIKASLEEGEKKHRARKGKTKEE